MIKRNSYINNDGLTMNIIKKIESEQIAKIGKKMQTLLLEIRKGWLQNNRR